MIDRDTGGMESDILKRFDLTGKVAAINGASGNDPRGSASEEFHGPTGSSGPVAQSFFNRDSAPGFYDRADEVLECRSDDGRTLARTHKVVAYMPMGRLGQPDDLIGTLVWLLSDASSFVTGVVVPVDGGFSSYVI